MDAITGEQELGKMPPGAYELCLFFLFLFYLLAAFPRKA